MNKNEIIVKKQSELDAIEVGADIAIIIEGGTAIFPIIVSKTYKYRVQARGSSSVVARGSSRVEARESSRVEAWGSSSVVARESSSVVAWGSSSVEARGSSRVEARGSSRVVAWGSSSVDARGSSRVEARGSSRVEARGRVGVVARGRVGVRLFSTDATVTLFAFAVCWAMVKSKVTKKSKTAVVVNVTEPKSTFEGYTGEYPVKTVGKTAIMYKAVHRAADGRFLSDYDKSFIYEIGNVYEGKCAPVAAGSCAQGLHVAFKSWARSFGWGWKDLAILECEVAIGDIVVSADTDGKVRCSKLKVVRELPESEWIDIPGDVE